MGGDSAQCRGLCEAQGAGILPCLYSLPPSTCNKMGLHELHGEALGRVGHGLLSSQKKGAAACLARRMWMVFQAEWEISSSYAELIKYPATIMLPQNQPLEAFQKGKLFPLG